MAMTSGRMFQPALAFSPVLRMLEEETAMAAPSMALRPTVARFARPSWNLGKQRLGKPLLPCSAAIDCVGRATPGGPYCVDGYCAPGLCGSSYFGCNGSETAGQPCSCPFVEAGQPCDADPPVLGNTFEGTPVARWASSICAPGLTCAGLRADGTHGVCSVPQDIGGPCAQDSVIQGCSLGLTCQCGACQLPPTRGPCASLSCQVGIAYCDLQSNTCMPVKQIGGDCSAGMQVCPPNLVCDDTSTCELYSPL
jgi:hypothetical protein